MKFIRAFVVSITLLVFLAIPLGSPALAATTGPALEYSETQCIHDGNVCVQIAYARNCDGWVLVTRILMSRHPYTATMISVTPEEGPWTKPNLLESDQVTFRVESFLNQESLASLGTHDFVFEIVEPSECAPDACALKPKYYMYTLRDGNQPDSWLPYCYIISNDGFPSTKRQAQLCTVPGFDHTFQATQLVYSGWVSTGCGEPSYGWPAWNPDWYRSEFAID